MVRGNLGIWFRRMSENTAVKAKTECEKNLQRKAVSQSKESRLTSENVQYQKYFRT